MSHHDTADRPRVPTGPGDIAPGQRVTCLPGSLPAADGGQGFAVLARIGPATSLVDLYGGGQRRVRNTLLHPQAGPQVAAERERRGLLTARADGRGWLPSWSWLEWSIAQHVEFNQGERSLPVPPPPPTRLVLVACGARKAACFDAPAGQMYTGSFHRAARRAADALAGPGTRIMILSSRYGLLDLDDRIVRYEMRLGHPRAVSAAGLAEQAEQLGVRDVTDVTALLPKAYAGLARSVWPHATAPLHGSRGIGEQLHRLSAMSGRSS